MGAASEQEALAFIVTTLKDLTSDLDLPEITAQTSLKDLGLRSMVLINALADIQDHFELENRLLDRLLADAIPLFEHCVGDLAAKVAAVSGSRAD